MSELKSVYNEIWNISINLLIEKLNLDFDDRESYSKSDFEEWLKQRLIKV